MGRYIVKIKDKYTIWSTIIGAPIRWLKNLEDFKKEYLEDEMERIEKELEKRLERVENNDHSCEYPMSLDILLGGNRAGPDGSSELSLDEIYEQYSDES